MEECLTLEDELERRAKRGKDAKDFWHRYENMKGYLEKEYYPWVRDECPFVTDHGELHVRSVIQASTLLLDKHLSSQKRKKELSSLDIFLILSGILWHDVGMIYGRTGHASRVAEITNKVKRLGFPSPDIQRFVVEISKAHSGHDGLGMAKQQADCATVNQTYTVYPRSLAAIVRFADEISENRTRISQVHLENIPGENRIFWEYANCISASRADPARESIIVTMSVQDQVIAERFPCPEQFCSRSDQNKQISLIEYVICRLEKMNNERAYCAQEMHRYVPIRRIEARLAIYRGVERVEGYESEFVFGDPGLSQNGYPNIRIFEDFFTQHPQWHPIRLKELLN